MKLNKNKGSTLIELIIIIVVLSLLSIFLFSFISSAVSTYTLTREQRRLYSEGVYIMERVARELSDATTVTTPLSGTSSSRLTFTTPAHIGRPFATVDFEQSGRNLTRNGIIIGRNVNVPSVPGDYGFKVTNNPAIPPPSGTGEETITVELKLTSQSDPSIPPFELRTKITPNNYGPGIYTGRSFNGDYYEKIE